MESESYKVLTSRDSRTLLGFKEDSSIANGSSHVRDADWTQYISQAINSWPRTGDLLPIGHAAFEAFLQANVTGPPLTWDSANVVFPSRVFDETKNTLTGLRKQLIVSLRIDGEAVYQLVPKIELFYLAKCILNSPQVKNDTRWVLARLRVNFWHQRMISDISPTLQDIIYKDLDLLENNLLAPPAGSDWISHEQFLIERAAIHTHHGMDTKARDDLKSAAKERSFDFALTGRLGKRTKFQEKEVSQLVILARSKEPQDVARPEILDSQSSPTDVSRNEKPTSNSAPQSLELNDDTLLESIAYTAKEKSSSVSQLDENLPSSLQSLDPGNQPLLEPLDAIILLATAASITNTSPTDGLTREETLPYAERVISGGSSNWQIYTQALLLRSRIEGYRSRTVERGVLQLQAVVDQVIAETTSTESIQGDSNADGITSFLPQPKRSESAPVSERLKYIHQLASPPRWKLESELADRWISLGALRTALEIYERLQMWAEVALCWAANDQEANAKTIIRRQLYNPKDLKSIEEPLEDDQDQDSGDLSKEKNPLPADAPRLFCILGDIEKSTAAYERAWEISNHRYARAQRSLGKFYSAAGDMPRADEAYSKSLKVNPQNHSTWFALGCIRLQTEDWAGAVDAFGRTVQIEDSDAESWSNLAVALLKLPPSASLGISAERENEDESPTNNPPAFDPQKHIREAFVALKRAAALKRDSFRIWQNLLSVAVKLSPPPYTDIIIAQTRLIDLLGKLEGEKCLDVEIVEALVAHLVASTPSPTQRAVNNETEENPPSNEPSRKTGFEKMLIDLVQKKITPLITSSRRLWLLTAKLSLHLNHPSAALSSFEKAWRVTLNQPGWESGGSIQATKNSWKEVWESTIDLVDAYESLGERTRESGMGAGELVAKDWKFKARSAVRSVLARAKEGWEGDEGFESLQEKMQDLKGV